MDNDKHFTMKPAAGDGDKKKQTYVGATTVRGTGFQLLRIRDHQRRPID